MTDWAENIIFFFFEKIFIPGFALGLIVIVVAAPFGIYACIQQAHSPEFSLKKDEWSCSKTYEYTTTTMVMVGHVMVPQTITHNDCIEWSRK